MLFKKQKSEPKTDKKREIDFILPLYLNQRIVYDILAIKNDGFTEFYEIMIKKKKIMNLDLKLMQILELIMNFL